MYRTALIRPDWTPATIGLMVLGFFVFWPLGLAMLAYILFGERLQACGQVKGFADASMPLRLTGTHMIANYNHTSRDTNADLKWRQHLKIADSFDQSQTRAHGSLDIIFMSCWIGDAQE